MYLHFILDNAYKLLLSTILLSVLEKSETPWFKKLTVNNDSEMIKGNFYPVFFSLCIGVCRYFNSSDFKVCKL